MQEETLHTRRFRDRFGFSFQGLPYAFEDIPNLREKDLNAFLDLAPVYDPSGLCEEFRRRIRADYDPFEHFLHVRRLWLRQLERAGVTAERIDRFDLKYSTGPMPHDQLMRGLQLYGEKVIPMVKDMLNA